MRAWRGVVDGALLRSLGASPARVARFEAEAGAGGAELLVDECVAVWASAGGRAPPGVDAWWLAQALLDPEHRESIRLELSPEAAALAAAAGADLWPFSVPSADDVPWGWHAWDDRGRWSLYRLRGCAFELRYERLGPFSIGAVHVAGRPMEGFSSSLGLAWGDVSPPPPRPDVAAFGGALARARLALAMSVRGLADALADHAISPAEVARWEAGARVPGAAACRALLALLPELWHAMAPPSPPPPRLFWHLAPADLRALLELAPACDWDAWEFEPLTSAQRYEDLARRFPR